MSAPTPDPAPDSDAHADEAPTPAGERGDGTERTTTKGRRRRPLLLAGAGVAILAAVWGGLALVTTQHLFGDASVAGTKVGGMSPAAARSAVTEAVDAELAAPVTITVGDASDTLVPADSGVSANAADAVERLTSFTLNPVTIAHRLSGESVDAARVTTVDADALRSALVAKLGALSTGTADASVTLDGATPVLHPGTVGTGLDVDAKAALVRAQLTDALVPPPAQVEPDGFNEGALHRRGCDQLIQHVGAERPNAFDLQYLFR